MIKKKDRNWFLARCLSRYLKVMPRIDWTEEVFEAELITYEDF